MGVIIKNADCHVPVPLRHNADGETQGGVLQVARLVVSKPKGSPIVAFSPLKIN